MSRRTESVYPLPKTTARAEPDELQGVVLPQLVRCGKPTCRCAAGNRSDLHGPYHYRFWRERGRLKKAYVRRQDVEAARAACQRRQAREQRQRGQQREVMAFIREITQSAREVEQALAALRELGAWPEQ